MCELKEAERKKGNNQQQQNERTNERETNTARVDLILI